MYPVEYLDSEVEHTKRITQGGSHKDRLILLAYLTIVLDNRTQWHRMNMTYEYDA